jgi:tetratricopeptide (TPR) repeat protein
LSYPVYGIIVQNFVDYVLYIPQNSIIFFIFLSLLVKETKNKDEIVEKKIVWLYFFCIILLFIYCIVSFIKMDRIVVLSNSRQKENFYKSVSLDKTYWFGWKQIAVSLVNEGKLEEAEKMFMNVIKTNPTDVESYFFLSLINFKLGNNSEGYKFLKQILKVNPKIGYKYIGILKAELK